MMTYREGDRGEVVRLIQQAVKCAADGVWGPVTTECVRAYQLRNGLKPDGIAGPATLAEMGIDMLLGLKRSHRMINLIVIHCTATPDNRDVTVGQLRREHKAKGWSDVGYHYIIYRDGCVVFGRDVDIAGAHASGYNPNSIGIAYVGGLRHVPGVPVERLPKVDTRTEAQRNALLRLLKNLHRMYPEARICGHRDLSPDLNGNGTIEPCEWVKECPCFDAEKEYKGLVES